MKLAAAVMMAVVLAGNVQGKSDFGRQVTVYFNDRADVPFDVQGEAKAVAQGMFASIGITIHWRAGSPSEWDKGVIVIEMATGTPATRLPGAMAYALPYEGVHIVIFWDRIKDDSDCRKVLARVMVHEITHVLQGTSHHPDEGIMKAHWNSFEARTLRFTAGDVELIYEGMDERDASDKIIAPDTALAAEIQAVPGTLNQAVQSREARRAIVIH